MAEYIGSEALIAEIQKNINSYWNEGSGGYYLAEDALNYSVKTAPTADVVPKSEFERLEAELDDFTVVSLAECKVCEEKTTKVIADLQEKLSNAKTEDAREIFEEIEKKSCVISETNHSTGSTRVVCYQISAEKLAELKKKYTEQKQCPNCRYFVGCEKAIWVRFCDEYEENEKIATK